VALVPLAIAPALKTLLAIVALIPVGLVALAILVAAILLLAVLAGVVGMWTLGKAQERVLRPGPANRL
jgi:hypothetical protein